MKEQLGRFSTYFCIVISVYGALEIFIDMPGIGSGLWLNALLVSLNAAFTALTFENRIQLHSPYALLILASNLIYASEEVRIEDWSAEQ